MILVAPTAFKGTLGAAEAAAALAEGVRRAAPGAEVVARPLSDGGPGLLDALGGAGGRVRRARVSGPLGGDVEVRVLLAGGRAVLESADACGLHLVPPGRRDPLRASTFGVGEQVLAAAAALGEGRGGGAGGGIVLGLGGSATVDGGTGLARALGWRLLDGRGRELPPGGGALEALERILPPERPLRLPPVTALADVGNPLLGPDGAAAVFGPQKGADGEGVARLERGLARLAACLRQEPGVDVASLPGAGAAGGLGAGAVAFLGARLVPGSEWVLEAVGFEELLARAELVVTGEGCYDAQSGMGKIAGRVVERARAAGVPVLLVAGRIEAPLPAGVTGVDGGGRMLTPPALAAVAEEAVARLLNRTPGG